MKHQGKEALIDNSVQMKVYFSASWPRCFIVSEYLCFVIEKFT